MRAKVDSNMPLWTVVRLYRRLDAKFDIGKIMKGLLMKRILSLIIAMVMIIMCIVSISAEIIDLAPDGYYNPSVCEGKNNIPREGYVYYKTTDPNFSFKNVSREYLLKHNG